MLSLGDSKKYAELSRYKEVCWAYRKARSTFTLFFFYKNKVYENSEPQNRDILRTSLEQFEAEKFKILRTF